MSGTLRRRLPGLFAALVLVAVAAGMSVGVARVVRSPGPDPVGDVANMVAFSALAVVGAFILTRRPGNRMGWLFSAIGLMVAAFPTLEETSMKVADVVAGGGTPGHLDLAVAVLHQMWWYPLAGAIFILVPLLYPSGRSLSARWAVIGWLGMASVTGVAVQGALQERLYFHVEGPEPHQEVVIAVDNPIGFLPFEDPEDDGVGPVLLGAATLASTGAWVSAVVRYRRGNVTERLQMKWVTWAVSLLVGWTLVTDVLWVDVLGHERSLGNGNLAFGIAVAGIALAALIAILRYRLYEIDRIISRTVTYGLVAGVLAVVYAGGVFLVQGVIGAEGDLAVAASTLAAFALFAPLRRRVQRGVDRRFNRSRYDAARVVEGLASRLRDRVDLEVVTAELVGAARSALQPATVAVWVREQ